MTSSSFGIDLLPHKPPMRLIDEVLTIVAGESAHAIRVTRLEDWYFQGHFPGDPVVPAVVLVELLAQTGGLAVASASEVKAGKRRLRVAGIGPFKFPAGAGPGQKLEAKARVIGRMGGIIKVEGEVLADGRRVAWGTIVLAEVPSEPSSIGENHR